VISLIKEQIMPLPLFQFNMTFEKDAVAGELGNKWKTAVRHSG
jgi:hypothetical protein